MLGARLWGGFVSLPLVVQLFLDFPCETGTTDRSVVIESLALQCLVRAGNDGFGDTSVRSEGSAVLSSSSCRFDRLVIFDDSLVTVPWPLRRHFPCTRNDVFCLPPGHLREFDSLLMCSDLIDFISYLRPELVFRQREEIVRSDEVRSIRRGCSLVELRDMSHRS